MATNQISPHKDTETLDNKNFLIDRRIRGYSILAKGDKPIAVSNEEFLVPSQNSDKKYKVTSINGWNCECPDFQSRCKERGMKCKHIMCIEFWTKLRNSQDNEVLGFFEDLNLTENEKNCPECKSKNIVNNGKRKTKIGIRQRYSCKDCQKRFTLEPLKNHLLNAKMLCLACDLYFKGNSLRDIKDTLFQSFGVKINHETIRQNILKFTNKMNEYSNKLNPQLSKNWGVDEQKVKCKGEWLWKWNLIDKKTRWQVANNLTQQRSIKEARQVFKKGKENLQKNKHDESFKDLEISSDGLYSYREAIRKEFLTMRRNSVEHRPTTSPKVKQWENMLVERFHNQYREFDKIRRDFKTEETLEQWGNGFRVYNNFIQKNNGSYLKGLTPAQACGIDVLGRNRWLSLLKLSLSPELDKQKHHP
ncbi:IS1/IS6 family transposase [Candidatus Woesearchaeota archaeon]|nr:IS1/IS6 family transposase [Candidatus Woesearchaeota archaeon]